MPQENAGKIRGAINLRRKDLPTVAVADLHSYWRLTVLKSKEAVI